jgi:hypothetical protein
MAKRYSGTLILTLKYIDATSSYTVQIREKDDSARFATLTDLRLAPIHANLAVDSPKAYDLAAEAALGFASYEDDHIHVYGCPAEVFQDKWHIGRSPKSAYSAKWCD